MRAIGWCALVVALLAIGCEAMEDATATNRALRERYGVEETSVHVRRTAGRTVVTIEASMSGGVGADEVGERLRGMATTAAERMELAEGDSVVVSLSSGSSGSAARARVTHRYEVEELIPADR